MQAGDLDITLANNNDQVVTDFTYVGDSDRVATIKKKFVNAAAGVTQTWTRTYSYDSKNRLINTSAWVYKVVSTASLEEEEEDPRDAYRNTSIFGN